MKHPFTRALLACALCLLLVLPAAGLAEGVIDSLENSDTVKQPLNPDLVANLTLNLENIDATIKAVAEDEDPYAELDATVLGIDSDDVTYNMSITELENLLYVDAYHRGDNIGIDRVKLTLYVPAEGIENLSLTANGGSLTIDGVPVQMLKGNATGAEITAAAAVIASVSLSGEDTKINLHGEINGMSITATGGEVTVHTSVLPVPAAIIATNADVTLQLPDTDEGFQLQYDVSGNGEVDTDFTDTTIADQGSVTVGEGKALVSITMDGGSLRLHKQ